MGMLNLFGHGLRDTFVVVCQSSFPDVGRGDGVDDPFAADFGVLSPGTRLAIPKDVLTLHASIGVPVLG